MSVKKKQQIILKKQGQGRSLMVSGHNNRTNSLNDLATKSKSNTISLKIHNNKNVYFVKDDEDNYQGFIPLGYDCYDPDKHVDDLFVVKKFNPSKYEFAYQAASKKAYDIEKEANKKYTTDLQKIALEKERDIVAARVSSARKIGKANLLVAMHEFATSEQKRHEEILKKIKRKKPLLIERNDQELKEVLAKLVYNHEIEILNLNANKNKRLAHLDKEKEIRELRASNMERKIKNYSVGKNYNEKVSNQDISKISHKYKVYDSNDKILTLEINKIKKALSKINYNKLNAKEKAIYEKFMSLSKKDDEVYKKLEEIYFYKDALALARNNGQRKYMVVDHKNKNNILNANKEKFMIVEDAKKFANDYRSLHQLYDMYGPVERTSSSNSLGRKEIEEEYSKREINHSIHKWERVLKAIEKNDDYNITNLGNGYYKINYLNNVDSYEDNNRNIFTSRRTTSLDDSQTIASEDKRSSFINSFSESWNNLTQSIKDKKNLYSPSKMKKLYADFKQLIESDIVQENINLFHQKGLFLDEILHKFSSCNLDRFERNYENMHFIKEEVGKVFKIYYYLVDEQIEGKKRIELAEKLRRQQDAINQRNLVYFNNQAIRIDQDYKRTFDKKKKNYEKAVEHAKNMHFIRNNEIIDGYEQAIANEHKRHYQNVALYKQQIRQEEAKLHNAQNQEISLIIRKIQAFNNRNPEDRISISNLPVLINPKAASQNIKVKTDYVNNKIVASTSLKDYELFAKTLNKDAPDLGFGEIIVLDKFRSIEDPYKRSAILKELAKNELDKEMKKIEKVETEKLNIANTNFKKQMKSVNNIRTDAEIILLQKEIFDSESKKYLLVNNAKKRFNHNVKVAIENNRKKTESKITNNIKTKKQNPKPLPMSEKDQNLFIQKIQRKLHINPKQETKTKIISKEKNRYLVLPSDANKKNLSLDEVILVKK